MFGAEYKLQEVVRQKNKAFSIFQKTAEKLERAIALARQSKDDNKVELDKLNAFNYSLDHHINSMDKSLKDIQKIIGA